MVLEAKAQTIIMLTRLVEGDRTKCAEVSPATLFHSCVACKSPAKGPRLPSSSLARFCTCMQPANLCTLCTLLTPAVCPFPSCFASQYFSPK
jgi:hypothetical protein